jgi:hypothetical protein
MKKIFFLTLICAVITTSNAQQYFTEAFDNVFVMIDRTEITTMKQAPYKTSIGGIFSPIIAIGFSSKYFLKENFSIQTDIFFKGMVTHWNNNRDERIGAAFYLSVVSNTNFMYQQKLKAKKNNELYGFIGGGLSFGFEISGNSKFGANAILGLELVFLKVPICIQWDIRPGYGVIFNDSGWLNFTMFSYPSKSPWHHFDYLVGFSLRYTFKNK